MNLSTIDRDDGLVAYWPLNEGVGALVQDKVTGIKDKIQYVFNASRYKPPSSPMWVAGISGNALLFDGYSTYISRKSTDMPGQRFDALTIEAWVAPRSFEWGDEGRLSAIINQHHRERKQGYVLGIFRHGTWSLQVGTGDEWLEVWSFERPINGDHWSYIVGVFDGVQGLMSLYIDGEPVAHRIFAKGLFIHPCNEDVLIGKNNHPARINEVFSANMFNGIITELKAYRRALSDNEIAQNYQTVANSFAGGSLPPPDTAQKRSRYEGDPHRPQYHFIPAEHWMNEPHGPLWFNGQYHIFYQHNPQGPYWHQIHWGHAVSKDMVHWRDLPFALTPERGAVDPDGCWSGSTMVDDEGVPVIFYTAGDDSKSPNQSVAMARSTYKSDGDNDLTNWIKRIEPTVVQTAGVGLFGQFRDPYIFKDGGIWYMLVGSGLEERGGTALVYTSTDLVHWDYRNPLFIGDAKWFPATGDVWELPVMLSLGKHVDGEDKHLLLVNPWFAKPSPFYSKYIFYWIGTWNRSACTFTPDIDCPQVIDVGEHFIGPSGFVDPRGRVVMFTVIPSLSPSHSYELGWFGNAGLPTVLKLRDDGQLGMEPIEELQSLRTEKLLSITDSLSVVAVNRQIENIKGNMLEIMLEVEPSAMTDCGLKVRRTPDGAEETRLSYNAQTDSFVANRTKSSLDPDMPQGIEGGIVNLRGEHLKLHVYVDHSIIEAFVNGRKRLTTTVYPTRLDAIGMQLMGDMSVTVKSLEVWRLGSAY